MKWLVLSNEKSKDCEVLESFFKKKQVEYTFFFLTNHMKKHQSKSFTQLTDLLNSASQCIFLHLQDGKNKSLVSYALGFLIAQSIPFSGVGMLPKIYQSFEFPPFSKNTNELITSIESHFDLFLKQHYEQEAKKELFSLGVPLTPDAFSQYISRENFKICNLFHQAGMSVNATDAAGIPMLCLAVRSGRILMVEWLIQQGADVNCVSADRGYTPLMDAIWKNDYTLIQFFIKHGSNLNTISKDGQSVSVLAIGVGNIKVCKLLAESGADLLLKDHMGMSAIDYARIFKKQLILEIFEKEAQCRS